MGDGVADDTAAVQAALYCAVDSAHRAFGHEPALCLGRPAYRIDSPLTISASTDPNGVLYDQSAVGPSVLGIGPELSKLVLTTGISVFHAELPDDGYCTQGPCDATTALPLSRVHFDDFGIEIANGGFAMGIDLTGFVDSSVQNVTITFDPGSYGVGLYMRGSTGLLKGRGAKNNSVEDLIWTSPPGPSSPTLAYGILLDPGDTADLANGPVANRFVGGRFTGGMVECESMRGSQTTSAR